MLGAADAAQLFSRCLLELFDSKSIAIHAGIYYYIHRIIV